MAVQKSKVSRSRKGQRRSHHALKNASLSTDSVTDVGGMKELFAVNSSIVKSS